MISLSFLGISLSFLGSFKNLVELEASLAPAEAEVGAVAKADQYNENICIAGERGGVHRGPTSVHTILEEQYLM